MIEMRYTEGQIFGEILKSCDHERRVRGVTPFQWKRCGSYQTVSEKRTQYGVVHYCQRHTGRNK